MCGADNTTASERLISRLGLKKTSFFMFSEKKQEKLMFFFPEPVLSAFIKQAAEDAEGAWWKRVFWRGRFCKKRNTFFEEKNKIKTCVFIGPGYFPGSCEV